MPAESEIVIEGLIDTEYLEPEAPFGESHGHVALEEFNMPMRVTAITHRKKPVIPSYISQVAPSESSVIKRVAYEPLFTRASARHARHPRRQEGALHEPLTGLLRVTVDHAGEGHPAHRSVARAPRRRLFKGDCGKICIAVNEDIDVDNADAPAVGDGLSHESDRGRADLLPHRGQGHGPKREHDQEEDSTLLMDATMKGDMPPLALPKQEYMERAKAIWQELGLPAAAPAGAVVRLFAGRLAAAMGRGRQARGAGALPRQRQDQRDAAPQGPQAGDQVPAGQRRQRQGVSVKPAICGCCRKQARQRGFGWVGRPIEFEHRTQIVRDRASAIAARPIAELLARPLPQQALLDLLGLQFGGFDLLAERGVALSPSRP